VFLFGNGWTGVSGLEKYLAVVLCATANGESGSSSKLGFCVDQHHVLLGTRKLVLKNVFERTFAYNRIFRK
jgi:hypothetical protein